MGGTPRDHYSVTAHSARVGKLRSHLGSDATYYPPNQHRKECVGLKRPLLLTVKQSNSRKFYNTPKQKQKQKHKVGKRYHNIIILSIFGPLIYYLFGPFSYMMTRKMKMIPWFPSLPQKSLFSLFAQKWWSSLQYEFGLLIHWKFSNTPTMSYLGHDMLESHYIVTLSHPFFYKYILTLPFYFPGHYKCIR